MINFNKIKINHPVYGLINVSKVLQNVPNAGLVQVWPKESSVVDPPPPPPPTPPAEGQFLFATEEERLIWRQRIGSDAGTPKFLSLGDVQTGSPADGERIISYANAFRMNPISTRYRNWYAGSGPWPYGAQKPGSYPTGLGINATITDGMESRPNAIQGYDTSADGLSYAAFYYYLTQDETYAAPVVSELMHYTSVAALDFGDSNKWPSSANFNQNPLFFIGRFMTKCCIAYDFIQNCILLTTDPQAANRKVTIENWLLNAARYFKLELDDSDLHRLFTNRYADNYKTTSVDDNTARDYYHQTATGGNSDPIFGLQYKYNNRLYDIFLAYALIGIKLSDNDLINAAKRQFKETIAFYLHRDGTPGELERSTPTRPEAGYSYAMLTLTDMILVAEAYARKYSNELYEYHIDDLEFTKFYGQNTERNWYPYIAAKNKSLKAWIFTMLKYSKNDIYGYGLNRNFGDDPIDGFIDNNYNKIFDSWMSIANLYYKDSRFTDIYMRTLEGARPWPSNGITGTSNSSWIYGWDFTGIVPGLMLRYAQMEELVNPYVQ